MRYTSFGLTFDDGPDAPGNYTSCDRYRELLDKITALQGAGKWKRAEALVRIRREFDHLHLGHAEAQV